jgi:hypothetical protein
MLDREGNGVLIDWHLAKAVDDLEGELVSMNVR